LNSGYGVAPGSAREKSWPSQALAATAPTPWPGPRDRPLPKPWAVVSDIRNPFFAELARGAEDAARAAGYDLVLCNIDLDPAKQMECSVRW